MSTLPKIDTLLAELKVDDARLLSDEAVHHLLEQLHRLVSAGAETEMAKVRDQLQDHIAALRDVIKTLHRASVSRPASAVAPHAHPE